MIIDIHSHIFPEKIAEHAMATLSPNMPDPPSHNGTRVGLLSTMSDAGIDMSVILPVMTDPHQFDSVLRYAAETTEAYFQRPEGRLLSFAGFHPDLSDYKEKLRIISDYGFKGIKLHPNYQGYVFNDMKYKRLIYEASSLGLITITHAGDDPYTPNEVFCSPEMILDVLKDVAPQKLILAHMGNNGHPEESLELLCGQNVYFDTAYASMHIPDDLLVRMIHAHGAENILFGSDSPWTSQKDSVNRIRSLTGISEKEKQQILGENAALLLHI